MRDPIGSISSNLWERRNSQTSLRAGQKFNPEILSSTSHLQIARIHRGFGVCGIECNGYADCMAEREGFEPSIELLAL